MSWAIAGRSRKRVAGGKSGLRLWRVRENRPRQGDAPGNARGLGCEFTLAVELRKVPQKIKPPVSSHLGGRPSAKPEAGLFRSSAFGKGEKVG